MSEDKEGKPIKLEFIENSEFLEEMAVQMDSEFLAAKQESIQESQETGTSLSSSPLIVTSPDSMATWSANGNRNPVAQALNNETLAARVAGTSDEDLYRKPRAGPLAYALRARDVVIQAQRTQRECVLLQAEIAVQKRELEVIRKDKEEYLKIIVDTINNRAASQPAGNSTTTTTNEFQLKNLGST